jgi:hypothetical protein
MRKKTRAVSPTRATELSEQAKIARLLEIAAEKSNDYADAMCSVAECFEPPDGCLSDTMLDAVYDKVHKLADNAKEKIPDYRRAARKLIAKLAQRTSRHVSRKKRGRK